MPIFRTSPIFWATAPAPDFSQYSASPALAANASPQALWQKFTTDLDVAGRQILDTFPRDAQIDQAEALKLELAADYLVMAAWLAYMKSRLLLPDLGGEDEPTGEEMAAALAFQMQRLEAMQNSGQLLMDRPQLGRDFFARGEPEKHPVETEEVLDVTLFELLQAYARQRRRGNKGDRTLHIEPFEVYTVEDALKRLRRLLGRTPDWQSLWSYLPEELRGGLFGRSAVASTFAASLELAKEGKVNIRQTDTFGPIFLRSRADSAEDTGPRVVSSGDGEAGEP